MEQQTVDHYEFLNVRKARCNLSVESFLQPFVSILCDFLGNKPHATLKETTTMLGIIAYTMPSCIYSIITIKIILAYEIPCENWLLCMKKVAEIITITKKVPPLRFRKYIKFEKYFSEKENKC